MKRSDLRTGMIVTLNCGRKGIVMIDVRNCGIFGDFISYPVGGWNDLCNWNNDLTSDAEYCSDIVKVEMCDYMGDLLEFDARSKRTLWERVTETPAEKEKRAIMKQVEMCDYIGDLLEFDARLWERVSRRRFAEKEKRKIVEQMEELTERLNKLEVK